MARIQPEENFELVAMVDRLVEAAKKTNPEIKNHSNFAVAMGLTAQAFNNISKRQSMSLSFLMKACKKFGLSLDYAVYGNDEIKEDYINIPRIGGGSVSFLAELIRLHKVRYLRANVEDGQLHIIYLDDRLLRTGLFAFGDPERPIFRKCQARIDGSLIVEGEVEPIITKEDRDKLNVIGKVIWIGAAP